MSYQSNVDARSPVSYYRLGEFLVVPSDEVSGGAYDGVSFDSSSEVSAPRDLALKPDGTKLYLLSGSALFQYTLGTAWNLGTASYDSVSFSVAGQISFADGLFFRPDGTSFYVTDSDNGDVHQYDLGAAWDLGTAAHAGSFSVSTEEQFPTCVFIKPDGTKMYLGGPDSDVVHQYTLGTAWDVTSGSYDSVSAATGSIQGLAFNSAGTRLYRDNDVSDTVHQWNLSAAWDLSTASDSGQTLDVSELSTPLGLFFDSGTGKLFVAGSTFSADDVFQYTLGSKFVEDTGTLGNDGVPATGLSLVAGLGDAAQAMLFDGSGKITISHDAAYSIATTGELAVEFLLGLGSYSASAQCLFGKGAGGAAGDREWEIIVVGGTTLRAISYDAAGDVVQRSEITLAADTDYHAGINFTGTTENDDIEIVLDGVQQSVTTNNGSGAGTVVAGSSDLTIGGRVDDTWILQDSVLGGAPIYDFNLTEAQYAADYLASGGLLPVRAAHTAVIPLRLARAHTAAIPLRVGAPHTAPIAFGVRAAHAAGIPLLHPVRAAHGAVFDLRAGDPVRAAHTAAIPLRVGRAHAAVAPLMAFVRRAHSAVWDLRIDVRAAHTAAVPLLDHDPVRRAHSAVFSLLGAPRTAVTMNVSATAGGGAIPVLSWDIRADEGGYLYEGEIDTDANGYGLVKVGDALTLDLFGEAYALVVESRRRDKRGPAGRRFVLGVRSPTVRFDFPRADPVTRTFDEPILARAAVEALLGEAVTWELVNWPIPAFRLAFEGASPIAAAQQIVEAAGGTMQTDPDGTLRVRHLYPASPKNLYQDATAARVIDDQDDVAASSESFEPRRLVDRLSLRDTVEGVFSDRLEFAADEDNDRAGTVHVYPSPWRTNVVVTHTSNASLQLTHLGETTREETEVVEFTAGTARLRYPIDALLAVTWLYDSLGGVSFEQHATEIAAGGEAGYSLAEITYRTRSIDYRLVSPTVDQAQLLLQEVA